MKKIYTLLLLCCFWNLSQAQVTQIYTDYNTFWTSASVNPTGGTGNSGTVSNPVMPDLSHNLLAFKFNGTVYSTGVDDAKLTANGITTFQTTKFRALPIPTVTMAAGSNYLVGLADMKDGIYHDSSASIPYFSPAISSGTQKAVYLTDGKQGLDLGTCLTNIPSGTNAAFTLSNNGITLSNVNDGVPDLLFCQAALPTISAGTTADELYFTEADGTTIVGTKITINMTQYANYPAVGKWMCDLIANSGLKALPTVEKDYRFFAADLSSFGITGANYTLAKRLIFKPGGSSDPAFIAFNEPSIGVAQQLVITAQPTTSSCNGSMPSNFTVQLSDSFGDAVQQSGIIITASMYSGPGQLLGTLTATTNASGIATFSTLSFEVGGDHTIQFSNTSLRAAVSATIAAATGCAANVWTGNTSTAWNVTGNWETAEIPNANYQVTIPAGRPRYPILTANAGAGDLIMGAGASITLNGKLFTIKGSITRDVTAYIDASATSSELYMSGTSAQTIPNGFLLNNNIANFTVDNAAGVTTNNAMNLTGVATVKSGNFETNNILTLVCSFSPHKTGQIGKLDGTISGSVTAEQCFPARRAFRFVSSSVTTSTSIRANWQENASSWNNNPNPGYGTHITGSSVDGVNGFDLQPSHNPSMYTFNNNTQAWSNINNTNVNTLTAGTPYRLLIRGSRSTDITSNSAVPTNTRLRSTGTVVKGPVSVNGLSTVNGNYSFVGNPFQAVVDMNTVMGSAYNLTNYYYIWDPTLGGVPQVGVSGGRGAYVTINASTGVSNVSASEGNRYLQPYQGFFVQTGSQGGAPQITFRETDKVTSATQTYVFKQSAYPFINLSLYNQDAFIDGNTVSDGLRIDFMPDGNNEVDNYDAPKFSNLDENVSRLSGANYMAMENRNMAQPNEELALDINQYRRNDYVFKIEIGHFEEMNVYLKDYYLNQKTLLTDDNISNINFNVDAAVPATTSAGRFAIVFEAMTLGTNDPLLDNQFKLYPNPVSGNDLYINALSSFTEAEVSVYNALGQKVLDKKVSSASNNQIALQIGSLGTGIYVLKLKTDKGIFNTKFIKE